MPLERMAVMDRGNKRAERLYCALAATRAPAERIRRAALGRAGGGDAIRRRSRRVPGRKSTRGTWLRDHDAGSLHIAGASRVRGR